MSCILTSLSNYNPAAIPDFSKELATSAVGSFILGSLLNGSWGAGLETGLAGSVATTIAAITTPFFENLASELPSEAKKAVCVAQNWCSLMTTGLLAYSVGRPNLWRHTLFLSVLSSFAPLMSSEPKSSTSFLFVKV